MVMKFSVKREKQKLIQSTGALPVYYVIWPGFFISTPLTIHALTPGLHLALVPLIKIGPVSEHATVLHARFLHVLF